MSLRLLTCRLGMYGLEAADLGRFGVRTARRRLFAPVLRLPDALRSARYQPRRAGPGASMFVVDNFSTVAGGVASALAIIAAAAATWRWLRAWRQRRALARSVEELRAASSRLRDAIVQIDHRVSEGVGWAGWAIWPDKIGPHVHLMNDLIVQAEALAAHARGRDVEAGLERLREDVESCALLLREAVDVYRSGTIENYRRAEGRPIPPGATGRDLTAALTPEVSVLAERLSREFTRLIRSCLYQVGEDHDARIFNSDWPITRAQIIDADPDWTPPRFPEGTTLAPPIGEGY
jgi:hypothetical protein